MRPTGSLHIGHLSVLQNWVSLQDEYECYYSIVDWHALTTGYEDKLDLKSLCREIALDWLSVGIDPEKSAVFVQSHVKEHAELHLLFSMFTRFPGWNAFRLIKTSFNSWVKPVKIFIPMDSWVILYCKRPIFWFTRPMPYR
jgi:tryptophanyl-tRNA synthetase